MRLALFEPDIPQNTGTILRLSACLGVAVDLIEPFGFAWDGEVMVQGDRTERYRAILERLKREDRVYPCACSRREVAEGPRAIDGAPLYPGTCREGLPPGRKARAWRMRVGDASVAFDDAVQGAIAQDLAQAVGDFVLLRADGHFAYQLAVVADDADQGITHVVRGADLLDSTPRQIFLFEALGLPAPAYAHLPVAVNAAGEKLSKQTRAAPIDGGNPAPALVEALDFLGQQPPADLRRASAAEVWAWALERWRLAAVPRVRAIAPLTSGSPPLHTA